MPTRVRVAARGAAGERNDRRGAAWWRARCCGERGVAARGVAACAVWRRARCGGARDAVARAVWRRNGCALRVHADHREG